MLEVACAAVKLKFPDTKRVIGIATDAPKFAGPSNSEDLLLMEFDDWNDERKAHYEDLNSELQFFETPQMQMIKRTMSEFPKAAKAGTATPKRVKVGRNDPCICGSGRKSKKCCGR